MLKNKGFPYSAVALLLLAVAATNAKRAGGVSGNSEQLLRGAADSRVSPGMRDAGYRYVVIDDCWQVGRDGQRTLIANPLNFLRHVSAGAPLDSKGFDIRHRDEGRKPAAAAPAR